MSMQKQTTRIPRGNKHVRSGGGPVRFRRPPSWKRKVFERDSKKVIVAGLVVGGGRPVAFAIKIDAPLVVIKTASDCLQTQSVNESHFLKDSILSEQQ
jgi:hypothetical protein